MPVTPLALLTDRPDPTWQAMSGGADPSLAARYPWTAATIMAVGGAAMITVAGVATGKPLLVTGVIAVVGGVVFAVIAKWSVRADERGRRARTGEE